MKRLMTAVLSGLLLVSTAYAAYPDRPIRIIVPAAAGGGSDSLARIVGPKMTELLGQSVIIETKPGASGTIGSQYVAKVEPDGYTLLITTNQNASTAVLMRNLPYDTVNDFVPVIGLVSTPMLLQVKGDSPIRSVSELVSEARKRPGGVSYGSAGAGNVSHLTGQELATQSNTKMVHVPYKGASQATTDLLGGHVTFVFNNPVSTMAMVKGGQLRALAVSTTSRLEALPEVPTMIESGFPKFDIGAWFGIVAPAKTPRDVVETLNATFNRILQMPDVRKRFAEMGVQVIGGSSEKFGKIVTDEIEIWRRLVKEGSIVPE